MRLNEESRQEVRDCLVQILQADPEGLSTRDLIEAVRFREVRLTSRQVHDILKNADHVKHSCRGEGNRTCSWWQLVE